MRTVFPFVIYPRNRRIEFEDAEKTKNVVFRSETLLLFSYAFQ